MDAKILYLAFVGLIFQVHSQVQAETFDNRLKDIERKLEKVDAVFEGLQQLCSNLRMTKGSGDLGDGIDNDSQDPKGDLGGGNDNDSHSHEGNGEDHLKDFVPTIKVTSVESSGLVDGKVNVKVIYDSEINCDIRWNVGYENSTYLVLLGEKQETIIENRNTRICIVSIDLPDIEILEWLIAVIIGSDDDVQLSFNITALLEEGAEPIDKFEYKILRYSPTEIVTDDMSQGFETTVEVTDNVVEAINEGYTAANIFFIYINTTSSPPEYSNAWGLSNDDLTIETKNGSDNELVLGLGKTLAKFGGYLSLRVEQRGVENKYLNDHQYGLRIRLINQATNTIMPPGVIAIQKKEPVQYYRGQYHSLSCLGASIPTPDIAIFKVKPDGKMKQLPADIDGESNIFHSQVINFYPTDAEKPDGTYVCRVSLGNEFIDTKFSVTKYVEIVFDERKTGLVKNSPREISISCKASGVPTPDFELRVNDEFGEDLMKSEDARYKHRIIKRKNNTKVSLTIEPPDPYISTIICVAKQIVTDGRVGPTKSFPIDIK